MVDRDGAIENLHQAYSRLIDASHGVQEINEHGIRIAPPMSFLIGGLADAVFSVTDLLEESRDV